MMIFVYGTLKRGFRANYKLDSGVFAGKAHTMSNFKIIGNSFPIAIPDSAGNKILGELYDVPMGVRNVLDMYEGYPSFYTRDILDCRLLETPKGQEDKGMYLVPAWMYYVPKTRADEYDMRHTLEPNDKGFLEWSRT